MSGRELNAEIIRAVAGIEDTEGAGTSGAADEIDPSTHGFKILRTLPWDAQQEFIDAPEATGGADEGPSIPGEETNQINFQGYIQGGATATTPPPWARIARMATFAQVIGASDVTYTLVADLSTVESGELGFEQDNQEVEQIFGVHLNMVMAFQQRGPAIYTARGFGLYQDPQEDDFAGVYGGSAWAGATSRPNRTAISGADRFKINNGGSDFFPVWHDFALDLGVDIRPVRDMNSGPSGILCYAVRARRPRLRVTIGAEVGAAIDIPTMYSDANDLVEHTMQVVWSDSAGMNLEFDIVATQAAKPRRRNLDGGVVLDLLYKIGDQSSAGLQIQQHA